MGVAAIIATPILALVGFLALRYRKRKLRKAEIKKVKESLGIENGANLPSKVRLVIFFSISLVLKWVLISNYRMNL